MTGFVAQPPFERYAEEVVQVAERMLAELHETFPMSSVFFTKLEDYVAILKKLPPPTTEPEALSILAMLGDFAIAVHEVRQRIEAEE